MARSKTDHHLHKYKAIKLEGVNTIFRCMIPKCTHVIRYPYLLNREAQCWYCSESFIITEDHLRRKIVHCLKCTYKGKPVVAKTPEGSSVDDIFENLLRGPNEL